MNISGWSNGAQNLRTIRGFPGQLFLFYVPASVTAAWPGGEVKSLVKVKLREGRPLSQYYFRHLAFWDNQKGIKRLVHLAVQLGCFTF